MPTSEKFTMQLCALYFRHDVMDQLSAESELEERVLGGESTGASSLMQLKGKGCQDARLLSAARVTPNNRLICLLVSVYARL